MKYRAEIDGLRALAVVPVILFHAGFEWFSGGFVGVDIFFVISGYLITTIIISEMAEGKFSIVNFYERRARRILPALFFMMFVCLPFAWFWLFPNDLGDFGQSLIAVSTFSSNIFFWSETGYFSKAAEFKPLIHTWSLAVEEQFYILFPLFLVFIWKLGVKWLMALLFISFVVSLGFSHWGSFNKPSVTFYFLPTRAWELLIGVFIAFNFKHGRLIKSDLTNQILSFMGASMVIYSIIWFDKNTPFPSLYALIPTVGAGLIIFSGNPNTIVNKILSFQPVVFVGLISYSAYLWHQPIMAFARIRLPGEPSNYLLAALCLSSFFVAYISWIWVENPFRGDKKHTRKLVFIFSILGAVFFTLTGLTLYKVTNISPNSIPNNPYTSLGDKISTKGSVCKAVVNENFSYCYFGSSKGKKSVLLYGDSHSEAISYELDRKFKEKNIRGVWVRSIVSNGFPCETTLFTVNAKNYNASSLSGCSNSFVSAMSYFKEAAILIIINRWTLKYYPVYGHIESPHFDNKYLKCKEADLPYREYVPISYDGVKINNFNNKKDSVNEFLKILPKDKNNILIFPVPEIGCDIYKLQLSHYKSTGKLMNELRFPVSEYDVRNNFIINIFEDFILNNSSDHIKPIRTREVFCNNGIQGNCSIIVKSKSLYLDDDHLSDFGASLIIKEVFKEM